MRAPDLTVTGNLDIGTESITPERCLTGEVTQFGYSDSGTATDAFDFRFIPTGGTLASFYAGQDIGVTHHLARVPRSRAVLPPTSAAPQGPLGSIAALWSSLSGYVYNDGLDNDGIKQAGDAGIPGVSVTLAGTDVAGNAVSLSTVTDSAGATRSPNCVPERTRSPKPNRPAGSTARTRKERRERASTGNDVLANIVLGAGVNGQNNNFGEVPMSPGIHVSKTDQRRAGGHGRSGVGHSRGKFRHLDLPT